MSILDDLLPIAETFGPWGIAVVVGIGGVKAVTSVLRDAGQVKSDAYDSATELYRSMYNDALERYHEVEERNDKLRSQLEAQRDADTHD